MLTVWIRRTFLSRVVTAFLRPHGLPLLLSINKTQVILQSSPNPMRQVIITESTPVKSKDFGVNSSWCGNKSQDTALFSLCSDLTAYMIMFDLCFIRYWYFPSHSPGLWRLFSQFKAGSLNTYSLASHLSSTLGEDSPPILRIPTGTASSIT